MEPEKDSPATPPPPDAALPEPEPPQGMDAITNPNVLDWLEHRERGIIGS